MSVAADRSASPPGTHLDLTGCAPTVVVDVPDWLDLSTSGGVRAVLDDALRRRPARLVVDLSRCELADAYGLGMLARIRHRSALQGTELVLTGVSPRLSRVMDLLGLAGVLPVADASARAAS